MPETAGSTRWSDDLAIMTLNDRRWSILGRTTEINDDVLAGKAEC